MRYEVPLLRGLFSHYRKGLPFWEQNLQRHLKEGKTPHQAFVPNDPELATKLGLSPREKVFFFAGGYGDWAAPLARETEVHYTDATRAIVDYVRKRHANSSIKSFAVRDALLWPQKPEHYHWSASFEPMPVHDFLELVGVRALLNSKGLLLSYTDKLNGVNWRAAQSTLEHVAKLYGAQLETREVKVRGLSGGRIGFPIVVLKLHTSDDARRKARLDLALLHELQRRTSTSLAGLLALKRVRALEATIHDVRSSLERLHALGQQQAPSTRHAVEVSEPEVVRRAAPSA